MADGEEEFVDAEASFAEEEPPDLPLHAAAFAGDLGRLAAALDSIPESRWGELDQRGNSCLHIAALRGDSAAVSLLLGRGMNADTRTRDGWSAQQLVLASTTLPCALETLLALHTGAVRQAEALQAQGADPRLLRELANLPDCTCKLSWSLNSPLFAPLLRRFAPSDVYTLTKLGSSLRVDGTLKGLGEMAVGGVRESETEQQEDEANSSRSGSWERGSFSLLVAPVRGSPTRLWYVDHDAKEVVDAQPVEPPRSAEALRRDAQELLRHAGELGKKSKLKLVDFTFAPLRTWRGGERREQAEGWDCAVWGAKGSVANQQRSPGDRSTTVKFSTFREYLAGADGAEPEPEPEAAAAAEEAAAAADAGSEGHSSEEGEEANLAASTQGAVASAAAPPATQKTGKARRFKGTVWLAEGHPLSVSHLFPLFDICAVLNKHFHKLRRFLDRFVTVDACPVRVQVPLLMTVYLEVALRDYKPAAELPPGFFEPPADYKKARLEDKLDAMEARMEELDRDDRDEQGAVVR